MHNRPQTSPVFAVWHEQEPVLQLVEGIAKLGDTPPETSSEDTGILAREDVTALCLSKISFH
jgi:hypothetical protein